MITIDGSEYKTPSIRKLILLLRPFSDQFFHSLYSRPFYLYYNLVYFIILINAFLAFSYSSIEPLDFKFAWIKYNFLYSSLLYFISLVIQSFYEFCLFVKRIRGQQKVMELFTILTEASQIKLAFLIPV